MSFLDHFKKAQAAYDSMMPPDDPVAHRYTGLAGTGSACFEFVDGEVVSVTEGNETVSFYDWDGEQWQLEAADRHAEELWQRGEEL